MLVVLKTVGFLLQVLYFLKVMPDISIYSSGRPYLKK